MILRLVSKQVLVPSDIIHVASVHGLQWNDGINKLIEQDYSVLECKDEATGLLPFMTFASSSREGRDHPVLNTLFEMMKKCPQAVQLYNTSNEQRLTKKRDNEMTHYDGTKLRKLN